ncbi:MAG: Smr/MutS family protein [Prevotella sp.]|nr:Smr/MutS family protein [Prevotella sp.]
MIYPNNFEKKIGFNDIRKMLRGNCLCTLGWECVGDMQFSDDAAWINEQLAQIREFRRIREEEDDFPLNYFFDVRQSVARLKLKGTHMEEQELFDLMRCLITISAIKQFLRPVDSDTPPRYPTLHKLSHTVPTFNDDIRKIQGILDKFGHVKDQASSTLFHIRLEQKKMEGSVSRTLNAILRSAQAEGHIDKDVAPTMRDGRLVIPVNPSVKRKIQGIVHDESATGKTLFIEPTAVVEANNRIRELDAEEKREIIRILSEVSDAIRPDADGILESFKFLAQIDFIQAKVQLAEQFNAFEPEVLPYPHIDWIRAYHPLLQESLQKHGKEMTPLEIKIERGILIISGPNAGGKSVCLKTTGLLQYMLQCGLSIPVGDRSTCGIFSNLLIDIGDEQSIEDDLSTYSSHLLNMKMMIRHADEHTLLLIDEFGTGTEPQIGGAIAEAVLKQFCEKKAWGVITTHYQNIKEFANQNEHVINGAMLYDRKDMRPLFQLQVGRPGSSFAIEIARKTGLPENVIKDASDIVGQDYIQSDKYLQDIVRDKRYWERKRETVHQREKDIEKTISRYETSVEEIDKERKAILRKAKEQAEELLREANRRIENTIREIREAEAEREATRRLREELNDFKQEVETIDSTKTDAAIEKKMQQILARRERQAQRKKEKEQKVQEVKDVRDIPAKKEKLSPKLSALLDHWQGGGEVKQDTRLNKETRKVIDEHKRGFSQEIDVRGMRGDEALLKVQHFIDDAILIGSSNVRILHGKGNGILRELIRNYLNAIPNVIGCRDEHVQFGGSGITVVDLG